MPDPPLYPSDPAERARALELEEFFDEELGPHIRLLAWHELRTDAERMAELGRSMLPGPLSGVGPVRAAAGRFGSAYVQLRFRVAGEDAAAAARTKIVAALDRLDAELERVDGGYLAGEDVLGRRPDRSLALLPARQPAQGPSLPDPPARLDEFFAPLRERRGARWIREIYARHRKPAA